MRKYHLFPFVFLLIGGLISCSKSNIDPSGDTVLQSNKDDILNYAKSKGLSGTMTSSGLYYALNTPGSSAVATAIGQEVEFNYTLYALLRSASNATVVTDKKVDSAFVSRSVFGALTDSGTGLVEGFLKMHEGDQATMLLPSALAFGDQSAYNGGIPANTPVRFDVKLIRARTEDQQINEYMTANKLTPTEVTTSGLRFIKTASNATGALPTASQTLRVRYRGNLLRSQSAFDSTGTGTAGFALGSSVAGFDEALRKLKVGEKATIIFPSKIGYGKDGYSSIPPYAPMRFDIELVSVQ